MSDTSLCMQEKTIPASENSFVEKKAETSAAHLLLLGVKLVWEILAN